VLLDATPPWRIADDAAYLLAREHVPAALQRLFVAAATEVAAGRSIDDFMAVPAGLGDEAKVAAQRQAVRGDLVRALQLRLDALVRAGAPLGVEVTRADVDALLPLAAKPGFDAVLEATQLAEEALASARTDAGRTVQAADQERDRVLDAWAAGDLMTAAVLPIVMTLGHVPEERSLLGTQEAVRALGRLAETRARRLRPGGADLVAASALRIGDRIELRAGDRVPADPEIAALLAAAPGQISRPLRSLCRMLDVELPLPAPPRAARPPKPAATGTARTAAPKPPSRSGRPRYVFGLRYPPPLLNPA